MRFLNKMPFPYASNKVFISDQFASISLFSKLQTGLFSWTFATDFDESIMVAVDSYSKFSLLIL